ncbi:hypothetical protein P5673_026563 [Acropora cervicornis]|uniref:Uncharacterized protein n=1 Tax=Acropora cervicornis TaxID=6130 RepID=A0AAD9Q170_ACRCE|nr:hypothetical protein P5673_026563 [Acropora cervicornis]
MKRVAIMQIKFSNFAIQTEAPETLDIIVEEEPQTSILANSDSVHKALTAMDMVEDSDVDSDFEFESEDETL